MRIAPATSPSMARRSKAADVFSTAEQILSGRVRDGNGDISAQGGQLAVNGEAVKEAA